MTAKESMNNLLNQLDGFLSTKSVIGEPMTLEDGTVMIPIVDVSFGCAAGAGDKRVEKEGKDFVGGGLGAKMSASAVLMVKDGQTRMINIKNQDAINRALDMVPEVVDRIGNWKNRKSDKAAVDAVKEANNGVEA